LATGARIDAKSVQTEEEAMISEKLRVEEIDTRCRFITYLNKYESGNRPTVNP
jgi:hypothetical protein